MADKLSDVEGDPNVLVFFEALQNEKTQEKRLVFRLPLDSPFDFVVVKVFEPESDILSVKFWCGDYENVKTHWRSQKPYDATPEELHVAAGLMAEVATTMMLVVGMPAQLRMPGPTQSESEIVLPD